MKTFVSYTSFTVTVNWLPHPRVASPWRHGGNHSGAATFPPPSTPPPRRRVRRPPAKPGLAPGRVAAGHLSARREGASGVRARLWLVLVRLRRSEGWRGAAVGSLRRGRSKGARDLALQQGRRQGEAQMRAGGHLAWCGRSVRRASGAWAGGGSAQEAPGREARQAGVTRGGSRGGGPGLGAMAFWPW